MQFSEFNEIIQLGGIMKKLFFIFCLVFVTFLNAQDDFKDWNEFTIIPFILEPGDMVYLGEGAGMPYNMSRNPFFF